MDSKGNKKTRSATQSAACKRRREDSRREAEKSRAFKESQNEKESAARRNLKENAQKVRSIYGPLKEQLQVLVEFINILEMRANIEHLSEIGFMIDFLENLRRHCEILMNCQAIKAGKNG